MLKYYIIFLDFDTDVVDVKEFNTEKAFEESLVIAQSEAIRLNYPQERCWVSFKAFSKDV